MNLNHFTLIGTVTTPPYQTSKDGPLAMKAKVIDVGDPSDSPQEYKLFFYEPLVHEIGWLQEGERVYIEGKVVLETWRPRGKPDVILASLRANVRYANRPPDDGRTLNNLSLLGPVAFAPRYERVSVRGEERDITIVVVRNSGTLFHIYTYDEEARAARFYEPGDVVFCDGTLKLHRNDSGTGLPWRMVVEAFHLEEASNSNRAQHAILSVAARSSGKEMKTLALLSSIDRTWPN